MSVVRDLAKVPYVGTERPGVRGPREAWQLVRPHMETLEVESFCIIVLDAQHRAIAIHEVTRGTLNSTLVHPREVFRPDDPPFRLTLSAERAAVLACQRGHVPALPGGITSGHAAEAACIALPEAARPRSVSAASPKRSRRPAPPCSPRPPARTAP